MNFSQYENELSRFSSVDRFLFSPLGPKDQRAIAFSWRPSSVRVAVRPCVRVAVHRRKSVLVGNFVH